jgi:DNA-nicking Smr family endonuclease
MDDDRLIGIAQMADDAPMLDLHGMSLYEAEHEVDRFLHRMFMAKESVVRIVHGKGGEVLAHNIPKIVKKHPMVRYSKPSLESFDVGAAIYAVLDIA